jgi:DNA-binding transcriptional LysR family regulator
MDIRHLRYFVEVARQKSFSKAAVAMHVSQSTISKTIIELEEELACTLFNRNSKHVQLTDVGEIFFAKAYQLVETFDNLPTELESMSGMVKGTINIGVPPITGATVFAELLGKFKTACPGIEIVLYEFGSKSVEAGIQDGSLDIGLICNYTQNDLYGIIHFAKDPLYAVVYKGHPLCSCDKVSFESLANESFVMFKKDFSLYDKILYRCKAAGFEPKVIVETSQRELILQTIANKLGISLLPSEICKEINPDSLVAIPMEDPQIYLELSMIWNKKRYLSFATRQWLEFMQNILKE